MSFWSFLDRNAFGLGWLLVFVLSVAMWSGREGCSVGGLRLDIGHAADAGAP